MKEQFNIIADISDIHLAIFFTVNSILSIIQTTFSDIHHALSFTVNSTLSIIQKTRDKLSLMIRQSTAPFLSYYIGSAGVSFIITKCPFINLLSSTFHYI